MDIYRIHLSSWTASFRFPNMISGFQPTLPVPPLSTINGLISAALGNYFALTTEKFGYVFRYAAKTVDLETIYQTGRGLTGIKSNVIKREFLFENDLYFYIDSQKIADAFRQPKYQLLLGRSGDLARVNSIHRINIQTKEKLTAVKGTVLPFNKYRIAAMVQALPVCFSNKIPRENIGTQPYYLVPFDNLQPITIQAVGFSDSVRTGKQKLSWDVYFQEIL